MRDVIDAKFRPVRSYPRWGGWYRLWVLLTLAWGLFVVLMFSTQHTIPPEPLPPFFERVPWPLIAIPSLFVGGVMWLIGWVAEGFRR